MRHASYRDRRGHVRRCGVDVLGVRAIWNGRRYKPGGADVDRVGGAPATVRFARRRWAWKGQRWRRSAGCARTSTSSGCSSRFADRRPRAARRGSCQFRRSGCARCSEWLRLDAAGGKKPDEALVFSNEVGEGVGSFRRAWVTAVLKAHDVEVKWCADGGWRHLSPECEEAFRRIDLHYHDLRHEYASRLVEHGVPLAQVRDLLGHASITGVRLPPGRPPPRPAP